jgi:GT2 family glycosyltransferase
VLAVIVLYKMQPCESPSFRTLRAAISGLGDGQADVKILLYDNTPGGHDVGSLPADVQYKADAENSGLAKAYNYALEIAQKEGFDWLLTLDQDTSLPTDFLCKLCHTARYVALLDRVAAIVPRVTDDGRAVSPFIITKYLIRTRSIPSETLGIPLERVYAINSASAFKVEALQAIGGYDPYFPLDYCDIVMFHRLQCSNFSVFVAENIHVEHEIAIFDLKNRSTPERYDRGVRAEGEFYDEYHEDAHIVLVLKLFIRAAYSVWKMGGSFPFFMLTLRFLCRTMFYSRQHRMESWKRLQRPEISKWKY